MLARLIFREFEILSKRTSPCLLQKLGTRIHTSSKFLSKIPTAADLVLRFPEPTQKYLRLMRADKPTGTWLILWPGLWSLSMASQSLILDPKLTALFCLGAFTMRSAGCVVNDLWDRKFDAKVERTKQRPLASGELKAMQGVVLLTGLASTSFAILLQLNQLSVILGCAVVPLVMLYPLAKRFTYYPQVVLGLTLNWGAILGFTAVTNSLSFAIIPTYFAIICWTLLYDTIYAHQDKNDDIMIGVKSLALKLGSDTRPYLALFAGGLIGGLSLSGLSLQMAYPYYIALTATTMHLLWQVTTVDLNSSKSCWSKFKSNLWIGWMIFGGILGSNYVKYRNETVVKKKNMAIVTRDIDD